MPIAMLPHVLIAILVLLVAPWDIWEYRRLRAAPDGGKANFYMRTIAVLWLLTALSLLAVPLDATWIAPAYDAMLLSSFWWRMLGYLVFVLLAVLPWGQAVYLYFVKDKREKALKPLEKQAFMLPRNAWEHVLLGAASLSAGVGEEIIFRGFVLHYLLVWHWGLPLAVIGSSLLFGLGHAGMGWSGILRTGLLGAVFALMYLATGSLLLPIIAHACVDLQATAFSAMRARPATVLA